MQIGNRVQRINDCNAGVNAGDLGTVTGLTTHSAFAIVKWDKFPTGNPSNDEWHDVDNLIVMVGQTQAQLGPGEAIDVTDWVHEVQKGPAPEFVSGFTIKDTDTKPSNPKDRAATSRLDLSLFPQSAVIYGALAMTEGDCKYGGYNYRVAGVNMSVYVAALLRHVYKAYNGEWVDPVTKVPHFANAIACLAVLIDGYEQGNLKDDRPPVQDTAGLLKKAEEIVKHLQTLYPEGPGRFTEKE